MLLWFLVGFLLFIVAFRFYFYGSESSTDYERVIKGETRHGWQVAIPPRHLFKKYHDWPIVHKFQYGNGLWPSEIGDWVPLASVLQLLINPSISGGSVYSVNQYSLIQPNSSSTLLKLVAGGPDPIVSLCYLSSRIILVTYNQRGSSRMRLFLVDVITRTSRDFTVEMPGSIDVYFTLAYVSSDPKPRLHIVFDKHTFLTDADHKLEFIDVKYDCRGLKGTPLLLEPLSSESIVFPVGSRDTTTDCFFSGGFPIISMAYDEIDPLDIDKHLCFSFDRHKRWRMETMTRCLAKVRESPEGASVLNAAKAFSDLNPPTTLRWFPVPAIWPFRYLYAVPGGNEVLVLTKSGGILRRLVKTPSMKRLAAQSIFRAHPELKIFEVEEATGVEISDGIREDGTEEDSKIVYP